MNAKLNLTIQKTEQKQIEIQLPYYARLKSGTLYWKVYGENPTDCIQLDVPSEFNSFCGLNKTFTSVLFNSNANVEECTANDFDNALEKVMDGLREILLVH
jgi:hypothetical protein